MGTDKTEILETGVTDGHTVSGVCAGRIVAYWPSDYDASQGLRATGIDGYIPAMIVAAWGNNVPVACVNLQLFPDGGNIADSAPRWVTSRCYSTAPAKGCWTWIPKA